MMKIKRNKSILLSWIIALALAACSNQAANHSNKTLSDSSLIGIHQSDTSVTDSVNSEKAGLAKIYSQAIAEFIRAATKKDKIHFDTLFFGKHVYGQPDDFPDIELPGTIENTEIRLIAPEPGLKMQRENKSMVYINMMGWVEKTTAEFRLIVFSNGGAHQYDYYINFTFNPVDKEFELAEIQFENYLNVKKESVERITIYTNSGKNDSVKDNK